MSVFSRTVLSGSLLPLSLLPHLACGSPVGGTGGESGGATSGATTGADMGSGGDLTCSELDDLIQVYFAISPDPPHGTSSYNCTVAAIANTASNTKLTLDCVGGMEAETYTLTYGVTEHLAPELSVGAEVNLRTDYNFSPTPCLGSGPCHTMFALLDATALVPTLIAAGFDRALSNPLMDGAASLRLIDDVCPEPGSSCFIPYAIELSVADASAQAKQEQAVEVGGLRMSIDYATYFSSNEDCVGDGLDSYLLLIEAVPWGDKETGP